MEQNLRKIVPDQGLMSLLSTANPGLVQFTALMVLGLGLTVVWISLLSYGFFSLIFWAF
jgi:hypothetical protein